MARGLCFELFFGNLSHCSSSPFGQLFFIWLHLKVHTMAKSTVYIAVKMKRILHCNSLSLMSWKLCVSRFASQWLCYCSLWSHLQYEVIWWVCLMWNWLIVSIKKVSDSAGFEVESVLFSTLRSIFYIKSSEKLVLPFCVKPSCSCGCRNVLYFSITLVLLDVGLRFVIFTSQAEQSDESEVLLVRGDTAVSQLGIWGYHTAVTGCQHCHNSRTWSFSHYDHYLLLLSSSVMNLRNR